MLKKTTTSALILLALATFSACKGPQIKNQVRRVWSVQFDTCYCQWYNLNEVRKVTDFVPCADFYALNFPDLPPQEYCDDLVGFSAPIWAKQITPWGKEVLRWGKDTCK
jgi:hypothetical protein